MSQFGYGRLPREIHTMIAKYCQQPARKNLCLVSKCLYALQIKLLYEDVNLSLHDKDNSSTTILQHIHDDSPTLIDRDGRPSVPLTTLDLERMKRKRLQQDIYLHTMMLHPKYAKFVKKVKWTILTPGHYLEDLGRPDGDVLLRLWHVFSIMSNVHEVDFANGPLAEGINEADLMPASQQLFPSAISVRLVGIMDYRIANAVLNNGILSQLEHLEVNGLIEVIIPTYSRVSRYSESGPRTFTRHPTLFSKISGRCTALKSFTWRKLWIPMNTAIIANFPLLNSRYIAAQDDYHAGITFVNSVRPHLERLVFDRSIPRSGPKFLDKMFTSVFQPILLLYSWPCLKVLHLTGAVPVEMQWAKWTPERGKGADTLKGFLRAALGEKVDVYVPTGSSDVPWDPRYVDIFRDDSWRW